MVRTVSPTASCVRESVGQLSVERRTPVSRSWRPQLTSPGSGGSVTRSVYPGASPAPQDNQSERTAGPGELS